MCFVPFVRTFTAREIRELFSLRAGIETMAAELALPRLTEADLQRFEQILDRKGDAYQHGDIPTTVYLILEGSVSILLEDQEGREIVLAYLGPGDFFGEMCLFPEQKARTAIVRTRTQATDRGGGDRDRIEVLVGLLVDAGLRARANRASGVVGDTRQARRALARGRHAGHGVLVGQRERPPANVACSPSA